MVFIFLNDNKGAKPNDALQQIEKARGQIGIKMSGAAARTFSAAEGQRLQD
ncbi:MAG: hypothetical protein U5R06_20840 [candidate division KSB1 bacterium]|nr:hypothetical protein [candidate division KSB1 bacterium]